MGVMRFVVPPATSPENWPEVFRAYLSGVDGRVFPTRVELAGNVFTCRRHSSESAKLHVAWPVQGFGRPVVSTSSLCERETPYVLPVELARGKIGQLRDQVSAWELAGMSVPDDFEPLLKQAHRTLARSAAAQEDPEQATALASEALAAAFRAAELISRAYWQQQLADRRRKSPRLPSLLGCSLGHSRPEERWQPLFCSAFHAAFVPVEWRRVEPIEGEYHWDVYDEQLQWCAQNRLLAVAGPLIDLGPDGMPDWLAQWEHDFLNMQSFVCDFVETAISRYVGSVRNWEVSAHANTGGARALTEENRLALAARTLETASEVDEENQLMIRVEQPWGEYQAAGRHRLAPLQFVDALVRSAAPLQGINLQINVGYRPRGCAVRDLLDFSRLIDLWSLLGLPLHVTLAFPSSASVDPNASETVDVEAGGWKRPCSEQSQADWVAQYLPLLMAKQSVVGIYWSHFSDQTPHRFPHAGLLNQDGRAKPALEKFIHYRREYFSEDGGHV